MSDPFSTYPHNLQAFNQALLDCQDQVYSLAYYLLAEEKQATAVLQSAIEEVYREGDGKTGILKRQLLSRVLSACRDRISKEEASVSGLQGLLSSLPLDLRVAVILVDLLALDYEETARVMRYRPGQVRRTLARARLSLSGIDSSSEIR
ncbi:MAG: sigma factor-like helix-turn-helix DNA-binding protein [Anaerolineales bacterium]|jgi:DNA-directed RNA polymerase specialized sigma24 family protein